MLQDYRFLIKSMIDTMVNPVCYKERNGIYLGVNKIFTTQIAGIPEEEIVGYTLPEVVIKISERFPERSVVNNMLLVEHAVEWNRDDEQLFIHGGTSTHEYEGICADGMHRKFAVNKSTFNDEKGEIAGLVTVLQDITEQKEAERKLEKNEERYRIIIKQTGQIAFEYDVKSRKIFWSGATEKLLGFDVKDFENVDLEVWISRIHPEERDTVSKAFENCIKHGSKFCLEYRLRITGGNYIWIEEKTVCLKDEMGNVTRVLGVMKDITKRKVGQEKIEISEENYRSFIQNFKGIAFQLNENFFPEFMHGEVEQITGCTEEEFLSGQILWIGIVYPADKPLLVNDIMKIRSSPYNTSRELEFRILHKSGTVKWVHQIYQKIKGKDGIPDKYQGTVIDITKRKQAEEALLRLEITRKKEIHHRIKNNLQIISSLLDLQSEKFNGKECIGDSEVLEAFKESQDRVMSIALIHEELHHGDKDDVLNFSIYLKKLVENLFKTYRIVNADISLIEDLEGDILFDMDIAVPLGIIVNELISNSLKYAFIGSSKGEIRVGLYKEEVVNELSKGKEEFTRKSTKYTLVVSDNGVGILEATDLENPETLGLQLVNTLVDQIDGELELKRDNGTEFTITFTVTEKDNHCSAQPTQLIE